MSIYLSQINLIYFRCSLFLASFVSMLQHQALHVSLALYPVHKPLLANQRICVHRPRLRQSHVTSSNLDASLVQPPAPQQQPNSEDVLHKEVSMIEGQETGTTAAAAPRASSPASTGAAAPGKAGMTYDELYDDLDEDLSGEVTLLAPAQEKPKKPRRKEAKAAAAAAGAAEEAMAAEAAKAAAAQVQGKPLASIGNSPKGFASTCASTGLACIDTYIVHDRIHGSGKQACDTSLQCTHYRYTL